jgi:hypothetical protein
MKITKPVGKKGGDLAMNAKVLRILFRGLLAALVISAVFGGSASASPAWKFSGSELKAGETEVTVGVAVESSMTVPGALTKCEHMVYKLVISNSEAVGKGEVTEMPFYNCTTSAEGCTVDAIAAEKLPWPSHLNTVAGSNYVVFNKVNISILYGGALCPLGGMVATVTGSAGALFNNKTEAASFNAASFGATKTELKALGAAVEWEGVFPTEAFEWHREQPLTVG